MSDTPKPHRYDLWKFFHDNHNLTLLETELADIISAVNAEVEAEKIKLLEQSDKLRDEVERLREWGGRCQAEMEHQAKLTMDWKSIASRYHHATLRSWTEAQVNELDEIHDAFDQLNQQQCPS